MKDSQLSQLFSAVFEHAPQAMVIVDEHGRPCAINQAFIRLTGCNLNRLRGKDITALFQIRTESHRSLTPEEGESWQGKVSWMGGTRPIPMKLSVSRLPACERPGTCYLLLFERNNRKETKDQNHNPRHSQLEALGSLAGAIAHDLNNVLTSILGHVSYLSLCLPSDGSHRESLDAVSEGSRRAASMTRQILEFAKGEPSKFVPVSLAKVVREGVSLLNSTLPENIKLDIRSEDAAVVQGDESQLSQLVMNLEVNARDAMPNGGSILISVESVPFNKIDRLVRPRLEERSYVKLSVIDSGVGIPAHLQERIFEPFFTTKSSGEKHGSGTGLGLSTVFSIVQLHQGIIEVSSEEGNGTKFEIYLPAAEALERKVEKRREEELPTGNERILVVDDEEAVRTVIQRSLEHLGYTVETATNGIDAISRYQQNQENFSLVILDMIMPQMPGDEVFRRLLEVDSKVPVLVASGYTSDMRAQAILDSGGLGFIQKPFAVDELAREVRRCLDQKVEQH